MLTQKEIKQIEQFANELKKCSDNQSYNPPCATKVQLTPSWRYKKEILLLYTKTNIGSKVEKAFAELDQLHQEYESWRAKSITEDNEDKFRTLVDCLKGTLNDISDTLEQFVETAREESSSEKSAKTEKDTTRAKCLRIVNKIIGWLFKKTSHVIGAIIVAILVDVFAYFGWIERIKAVIYKILRLN